MGRATNHTKNPDVCLRCIPSIHPTIWPLILVAVAYGGPIEAPRQLGIWPFQTPDGPNNETMIRYFCNSANTPNARFRSSQTLRLSMGLRNR